MVYTSIESRGWTKSYLWWRICPRWCHIVGPGTARVACAARWPSPSENWCRTWRRYRTRRGCPPHGLSPSPEDNTGSVSHTHVHFTVCQWYWSWCKICTDTVHPAGGVQGNSPVGFKDCADETSWHRSGSHIHPARILVVIRTFLIYTLSKRWKSNREPRRTNPLGDRELVRVCRHLGCVELGGNYCDKVLEHMVIWNHNNINLKYTMHKHKKRRIYYAKHLIRMNCRISK